MLEPAWFAGAAVLHVTGYALADVPMRGAAREAARLVRAAGGRVAIDCAGVALIEQIGAPAFRERMEELEPDVVLGTSREVSLLGGAPSLAPVVVEKRGAEGAVLHAGGARTAVAAIPAAVVDTTGAGDALAGSLLGRLAQGRSPLDSLRGAVADAASCVGAPGAMPALE
jgi:sugar/nucleoside kinase (ribokinase family)